MANNNPEVDRRFDFAIKIIAEAHKNVLSYYGRDVEVFSKDALSPVVTAADMTTEELIRKAIAKTFPSDGIFGEEYDDLHGDSAYTWTIDPIDGTISFIHGVPLFSTMIGLMHDGVPVMGISHFPAIEETIYARKGAGTFWRNSLSGAFSKVSASKTPHLSDAIFLHSGISYFEKTGQRNIFDAVHNATNLSRSWGDAFGHLLVATGRADVMIDPAMKIWDIVPIKVIVEGAGGFFCDIKGKDAIYSNSAVSTNKFLEKDLLKVVLGA